MTAAAPAPEPAAEEMMTPAEVAQAFGVSPDTVWRWARQGRLRSVRTPGGHRRYFAGDVRQLLLQGGDPR